MSLQGSARWRGKRTSSAGARSLPKLRPSYREASHSMKSSLKSGRSLMEQLSGSAIKFDATMKRGRVLVLPAGTQPTTGVDSLED